MQVRVGKRQVPIGYIVEQMSCSIEESSLDIKPHTDYKGNACLRRFTMMRVLVSADLVWRRGKHEGKEDMTANPFACFGNVVRGKC